MPLIALKVGVRKVIGAGKQELVFQFIGESITLTVIAFIVAMVVVQLLLSGFNAIADKNLSNGIFSNPIFFDWLLGYCDADWFVVWDLPGTCHYSF